jgi:hypothetical protein
LIQPIFMSLHFSFFKYFVSWYIQLPQPNVYLRGQCNAIKHISVSPERNNLFQNGMNEGNVQFFLLKIDPPSLPLELINYPIVSGVCSIKRDRNQLYSNFLSSLLGVEIILWKNPEYLTLQMLGMLILMGCQHLRVYLTTKFFKKSNDKGKKTL